MDKKNLDSVSKISILAPARGATVYMTIPDTEDAISILAPARGATGIACKQIITQKEFQSSLPRGERRRQFGCRVDIQHHFNPRSREGSDRQRWETEIPGVYFNPRSREGSDSSHALQDLRTPLFQSSLPRGERQTLCQFTGLKDKFQSSLPRGERRLLSEHELHAGVISILAPARGATRRAVYLSQHT